jgi:LPS export ABC transporter protein LptC
MIDYYMTKVRPLWILSIVLIIGFIAIQIYTESHVNIKKPSFQISSMKNFHLTHKEGNEIKWELSAENALLPTGDKKVILRSIALNINQTPRITLTSGSGVYEIDEGNITLNEDVELRVKDIKFITASLKWDNSEELISTDNIVQFKGANFLIEGTGLAADITTQKIRILKDVKAVIYN